MLYQVKDTNKPDTFRWWNTKVYIDAKRVDLPFLKTPTLGKESRIYIVVTEDYEIYKFPKLMYPNPIKDFFKWLKKKKKISIKVNQYMIEMNPSRIVWGGSQKEILKEKEKFLST